MTIEKAKEILADNCLNLVEAGMANIPVDTVQIETFEVMNPKKEDGETTWMDKAQLLGMLKKNKGGSNAHWPSNGDFICSSFMVVIWHDHYYRDYFSGAMEVIEALRVVNEWKDPYPDERVIVSV